MPPLTAVTVAILDDIIEDYKNKSEDKKRDWRTYEQRLAERLKKAFKELKPLVHEAVSTIRIVKGETRGAKLQLTLEQKVLALLLKHLIGKSNRNMSAMERASRANRKLFLCDYNVKGNRNYN